MAISNSYTNNSPITDSDLFVGTKYATNRTVNYTAQSIADYLNINSRISISGQLTFKFTILPNVAKTIAFENGGGDGRLFSSIDKLIVSILDAGGSNITVFLDYLVDGEILLAEQNQPNSFGHYKITSYTVTANLNFYELNLEYIGGNGNIYKDVYYDVTPWAASGSSSVGVQTVTGTNVDNTDPLNPVVNTPDLEQVLTVGDRIFKGPVSTYTIEAEDIYTYVAMREATPLSGSTITIDSDIFNKLNGVCLFSVFEGNGVINCLGVGTIANNGVENLTTLNYNQGDVISIKYAGDAGGPVYYIDIVNKSSGGGSQTLQQVTDEGATTDNTIYVTDGTNETSIQIGQVQILDGLGSSAQIAAQGAGFVNEDGTNYSIISLSSSWGDQYTGLFLSTQDGTSNAALQIKLPPEYYTDLPVENIVSNYFIPFKPSGDYTLATLDDIGTPNLQQVLEEGGNSALDEQIVLRNGSVIYPSSQSVWNALGIGIETGNKQSYLPAGELILVDTGGGGIIQLNATDKTLRIQDATIRTDLLNGTDRTYQLPDADGTIALTGDIPTTTSQLTNDGADGVNPFITALDIEPQTLQEVTDLGSVTSNNIQVTVGSASAYLTSDGLKADDGTTNYIFVLGNRILFNKNQTLELTTPTFTVPRTQTFQNASGTLALTSDIPAAGVTSVAQLTLGTTGTDLTSTVATGTTTPVITLNVPTASATSRGALSSADWTAFSNRKRQIVNDTISVTTTGVAVATLVKTYEITTGTLPISGFLDIFMYLTRSGATSGGYTLSISVNSVNNFATSTFIAGLSAPGNFVQTLPLKAKLVLKSGTVTGTIVSQGTGDNYPTMTSVPTPVTCNNTAGSVWFFVYVTPTSSGQSWTLQGVEITI